MNVECASCQLPVNGSNSQRAAGDGNNFVYVTQCGHICCELCRTNWFGNDRNTCPRCRTPQSLSTLIRLYYDLVETSIQDGASSSSQDAVIGNNNDAIDRACVQFHNRLADDDNYLDLSRRTGDFIDSLAEIEQHHYRRPFRLLGLALQSLSAKFKAFEHDYNRLKKKLKNANAASNYQIATLVEEINNQKALIDSREREMDGNERRWKAQSSSLYKDSTEAHLQIQTLNAELEVKNEEITKLKQSNLRWNKKYHALKQKSKPRKQTDEENSLQII